MILLLSASYSIRHLAASLEGINPPPSVCGSWQKLCPTCFAEPVFCQVILFHFHYLCGFVQTFICTSCKLGCKEWGWLHNILTAFSVQHHVCATAALFDLRPWCHKFVVVSVITVNCWVGDWLTQLLASMATIVAWAESWPCLESGTLSVSISIARTRAWTWTVSSHTNLYLHVFSAIRQAFFVSTSAGNNTKNRVLL